jgi:hypothetical protein
MFLSRRVISPDDADNPYTPPRADVGPLSMTGESETEVLRRTLAHLESFAKAVGILCIFVAIYVIVLVLYYSGWALLAKLRAIPTPWPFHRSAANIAIALGVLVAVTGLTAGYGLRHLRSWSPWVLGAFSLALLWQFVTFAYYGHQRGDRKDVLMMLGLGAMLLTPIVALWTLDVSSILSNDYVRAVADSPHIRVTAKLPLTVKCVMALLLLILVGLALSP